MDLWGGPIASDFLRGHTWEGADGERWAMSPENPGPGGGLGDVRLSELSDVWCHLVQL